MSPTLLSKNKNLDSHEINQEEQVFLTEIEEQINKMVENCLFSDQEKVWLEKQNKWSNEVLSSLRALKSAKKDLFPELKALFDDSNFQRARSKTIQRLLGLTYKSLEIDDSGVKDHGIHKFELEFPGSKRIEVAYHINEDSYELLKMEPQHRNYAKLREFLWTTSDFSGFLIHLHEHWKSKNESAEPMEISDA